MAPTAMLFRRCIESFTSAVTAESFGMEYELLCTELSLQWVRIQIWGEAAGMNLAATENLESSLLYRPDIEPTITQTIDCMISLLTEIEHLRHKYQTKLPPSIPPVVTTNDIKSPASYQALGTYGSPGNKVTLQQRVRRHHKNKSVFTKAKWALRDARRFSDKLGRLKRYVDALESITKAIDFTTYQPPGRLSSTDAHVECPPPYSDAAAPSPDSSVDSEESSSTPAPDACIVHRSFAHRRWGCIFPPGFNICNQGYCLCSQRHSGCSTPATQPAPRDPRTTSTRFCASSIEVFKSIRVSMEDTTGTIIPAALHKYNIDAPWQEYALYIIYEDQERCLRWEERPLKLYKQIESEGKRPMFMLRRVIQVVDGPEPGEHARTSHDGA